jgi:hypothetical protein
MASFGQSNPQNEMIGEGCLLETLLAVGVLDSYSRKEIRVVHQSVHHKLLMNKSCYFTQRERGGLSQLRKPLDNILYYCVQWKKLTEDC